MSRAASGPIAWEQDPAALTLLDSSGGPFQSSAFRDAWAEAPPGLADLSYAGRLADGTTAAVALTAVSRLAATSPPLGYGGVVATRALEPVEVLSFLDTARRAARRPELELTFLDLEHQALGTACGTTHIVRLDRPPTLGFEKKAHQSIRRAMRAGASVRRSDDGREFANLYAMTTEQRGFAYPASVIARIAARGGCSFYDVVIDATVVSSLVVVRGQSHWMYWLAAQNEEGRRAEAGYLAVAEMLEDAFACGTSFVNLGSSSSQGVELPGVARFKRRLGGLEQPMNTVRVVSRFGRSMRALLNVYRRGEVGR